MAEPLAPLKASGALYRPCYVEIAFFVSILFDIGPNISHSLHFTVLFGVVFSCYLHSARGENSRNREDNSGICLYLYTYKPLNML